MPEPDDIEREFAAILVTVSGKDAADLFDRQLKALAARVREWLEEKDKEYREHMQRFHAAPKEAQ